MEATTKKLALEARELICSKDIYIPIRYAGLLYSSIKVHGVDIDQVFQNTQVPVDKIFEQNYFISFEDYLTLCSNALAHTPRNDLALDYGKSLVLPSHGTWGLAVMTCPTLYEAIMLFKEYVTLELPFFIFDYQESSDHVTVEIRPTKAVEPYWQFHQEYIVIAEAINFIYAIQDNSDLEIHCAFSPPPYAHDLEELIGRKINFESSFTGARFQRKHLPVAMPDANHSSHIMLLDSLAQSRVNRRTQRNMREIIADLLNATPGSYPDQETAARALNISSRKLRYRLQEEKTSYKEIVSELKKRNAYERLQQGMSVTQVALELGYEDPSNFGRAFRKWFGVSPSEYQTIRQNQ